MTVAADLDTGRVARTDPNTVQSVRRAASLLNCFADSRQDKTLTELAAATGLTTSTAHRLLRTLAQAGLLWHDPRSERYLPGPSLLRLARSVLDSGDVASTREVMESLAVRTLLPVSLVVRVGGAVETVLRVGADGSAVPDARELPRLPLHATALGKVLLAYAVPDVGQADYGTGDALDSLPRFTPSTITSAGNLAEDLDLTRSRGYAAEALEHRPDQRGVAVPVRGDDGQVVASLGVVGTTESLPPEAVPKLGLELAAAAGALSLPRALLRDAAGAVAQPDEAC
ncbi:IclR family transcriptional regulator [Frankia tisae]|uniref:IclR family transcriptional regulator n=1 Tax=Frankia tisae TaxID=2950104 RepID=UPI0021C20991|nr:IclR family transcriptional regulator [Frankia tisae]